MSDEIAVLKEILAKLDAMNDVLEELRDAMITSNQELTTAILASAPPLDPREMS